MSISLSELAIMKYIILLKIPECHKKEDALTWQSEKIFCPTKKGLQKMKILCLVIWSEFGN